MVSNQAQGQSSRRVDDVVLAILCLFIPPLAVYLYEGGITQRFWINLILTLLFVLPGIIHAFLVIFVGI
ncbi:MAG: YqaE/Pmp3 family membrane protein [Flavobacteriia bacterium]|nr:YqaE/Pmp3 family membrane protein [Flavobacteriia bacterium]NBV67222.1 YqaE/Pmp3 family membrane protein [Flavobacteriia bacterium]NBV91636.1 YqaE/Pmp3 family membrane protein [Flavobacteriia bacterium]NBY40244.1 YqaE/Pmp3 family membrane protein [Flavobacteriia bacterium]